MECYTYLRNIQDLLSDRKTPYERRFGIPFKGPIIPFGSLVEYCPISAKDQLRIHQFGKKVLPGLFLGYALYAGGIGKGDIPVADIEELEQMDASMKNGKCVFPVADGTGKISGGDRRLRTSTLIRDRPERGEEPEIIRGETGGLSSPSPYQDDSTRDDAKVEKLFLVYYRRFHLSSSHGTPSQTVHAERRIMSYSTEVHRRYQNNTYVIVCIVGKTY